jgi:hypothetical protein
MSWDAIRWTTPVDDTPAYSGSDLLIHYGSPVITAKNTVIVAVKSGDSFRYEGHRGDTGVLLWSVGTDYMVPPHDWYPSCGATLTPAGQLIIPGSGGTVYILSGLDSTSTPSVTQAAFYGLSNYFNSQAFYDSGVQICTPITSDLNGNVYFGFTVTSYVPSQMTSGVARISSTGAGSYVTATSMLPGTDAQKPVLNCAPAISNDGKTLYIGISNGWGFGEGYLVGLDTSTLKTKYKVRLKDVKSGLDALMPDDGTATPAVGPDGDVFYGVLENPFLSNNDRGWMLHYDSTLTVTKTPGAFGWDDTAAIFPASVIPSFKGQSKYLLLTKYNNYADIGINGNGMNKVAVLAPDDPATEAISGATTMKEVATLLGQTPNSGLPGFREWCVNTVAIDPLDGLAFVNSEDGTVYRWDLVHGTITQKMALTPGIGEAYTPTVEGPDGTVYAISNAVLYALGNKYSSTVTAATLNGKSGDSATLTAQLARSIDSFPLYGETVTFSVGGKIVGKATTNVSGQVAVPYKVPATAMVGSSISYMVTFSGDGTYLTSTGSGTVNVIKHDVNITTGNVSGAASTTVPISITVKREDGVALANAALSFTCQGTTVGAVTNASGVATVQYAIPQGTAVGKYTFTVSYSGDFSDNAKSATGTLTVTK